MVATANQPLFTGKKGQIPIEFTDIELQFGAVVAEGQSQSILQDMQDTTKLQYCIRLHLVFFFMV